MRGSGNATEFHQVDWSSLKALLPYLTEFKGRIALALLCLIGAKLASVGLPFILKRVVDQLNVGETSLPGCLLYTSPSPRDKRQSRMPSSA